ncbi:MAG: hypothetical protein M5U34_35310 [Chloroflexi bacterium]|nr:hypothetical protein [Chloroflexota bacterium]
MRRRKKSDSDEWGTAVLPAVHKIYPGWWGGNGRSAHSLRKLSRWWGGNGRSARSLRKLARWWVETAVLPIVHENYPGGGWKRPFCGNMDLEMSGLATAVLWQHGFRNGRIGNGPQLTKIIQVVDGNGRSARSLRKLARWWVETAVLWQHGFRNGRIGNGRFARSLRKLSRWWVETAVLPAAYGNYPGGGNGRSTHSLRKLARWWVGTAVLPAAYGNYPGGGNGRSVPSLRSFSGDGEKADEN